MSSDDTNFDHLAEHFKKRIYGSRKGKIRLAVLERDLKLNIPDLETRKMKILDLGAGMAQLGLKLASTGHELCINDVSSNMLALAQEHAKSLNIENSVRWECGSYQYLSTDEYDLVLCHAVLEWLHSPSELIEKLSAFTKCSGLVSLMFYNVDALVFHNLVRGNFNKLDKNDLSGMKGGLTPPNPQSPRLVEKELVNQGFEVFYKSGVRVFSDYVGIKRGGNELEEEVIEKELLYSNQEPFVQMGRYVHFICRKLS